MYSLGRDCALCLYLLVASWSVLNATVLVLVLVLVIEAVPVSPKTRSRVVSCQNQSPSFIYNLAPRDQ